VIKLPSYIRNIINILNIYQYEAYVVGGAVRDTLLGKEPKDYDIVTSAKPDKVIDIFEKLNYQVIPTGLKHGTVTVLIDNNPVEVTTFRVDGKYSDNRRPDSVTFVETLEEDLSRRDITINAMAYHPDLGIIDYFGGESFLEQKCIKTVGNASERFQEDALRMMRAIRFSCQLDFKIEQYTFEGIQINAELIKNVSNERIRDELVKILLSDYPAKGIELLQKSWLLQYILPELNECVGFDQKNPHHNKDVFKHTLKVLENVPKNINVRLAALLHDIGKPITFSMGEDGFGHFYSHHMKGYDLTQDILRRLKFDNKTIENVPILVKEHMSRYPHIRKSNIKKLINRVGIDNIDNLINLQIADIIGSNPPFDFKNVIELKEEINRILNTEEPLSVKDLEISGYDLMQLGMKPGKKMGIALNELLEKVLENPELNTKNHLIEEAKSLLQTL
jgi:tRNA nucleotidyltransferase (CCA-adding enzyme)